MYINVMLTRTIFCDNFLNPFNALLMFLIRSDDGNYTKRQKKRSCQSACPL